MALNDRKKQILKSIVDAYIDSGEPVGSKYLTSHSNISLSPATIRNEMSELEEMGYLDKPHTSAGRVPSSIAYRLYVDELMENYRLTIEELDVINELAHCKVSELDNIINRVGKVMSDLTHCVTLSFTKDQLTGGGFSRFDTVYVDNSSFLLVMIPNGRGKVRSEHIRTEYFINEDSLTLIKNILNENLSYLPIDQVTVPVIMKMESQAGRLAPLINPIIRTIFSESSPEAEGNVKVNGLSNLLAYPEFSDVNKLRSIMDVFDKKNGYIKELLTSEKTYENDSDMGVSGLIPLETNNGMKIYIGDEEGSSALSNTSLVLCTVPVGDTESVIGILGPKRMDYKKAVSALRQFAESIEKAQTDTTNTNE